MSKKQKLPDFPWDEPLDKLVEFEEKHESFYFAGIPEISDEKMQALMHKCMIKEIVPALTILFAALDRANVPEKHV